MNKYRLRYIKAPLRLVVFTVLLILPQMIFAQCSPVIQNQSSSAGKCKCGFTEFCDPSTPPKYYLVSSGEASGSWDSSDACGDSETSSYDVTATITCDRMACTNAYVASGSCNYDWSTPLGDYSCSATVIGCGPNGAYLGGWGVGWSDGEDCAANADYEATQNWMSDETDCANTCSSTVYSISCSASFTSETGCMTAGEVSGDFTQTLSSEYTDDMVRADVMSLLPAYPAGWSDGSGSAFWFWDGADHICARGGKMQYRFWLCPQYGQGQTYKISWNEITTYANGTESISPKSEDVTTSGSPAGTYSSTHTVDVPQAECSFMEGDVTQTVEDSSDPGD